MLIATMATVGCSKSDTPNTTTTDGYEASTVEIGFNTTGDETKAATLMTDSNFEEFCVSAYYHSDDESADPIIYRTGQTVTKGNDGDWTYSPTMYWPVSGTLQFFAYSHSSDSGVSYTDDSESGFPKITLTPYTTVSNQIDFMTSQSEELSTSSSSVSFSFAHQLSQMAFYAKHNGAEADEVYITAITAEGVMIPAYGQFSTSGETTSFDWVWNDENEESTTQNYTVSQSAEELIIYNSNGQANLPTSDSDSDYKSLSYGNNGVLLIHPQTYTADQSIKLYVTFSYNGQEITQEVQFGAHTTTKNSCTNYQFTVDVANFTTTTLGTISIIDWVDGTSGGNIEGSTTY